MGAITRRATRRAENVPTNYLDDILVAERSRKKARRATRTVTRALTKAKFITSPKSTSSPQQTEVFVGKILNPRATAITNRPETLAAIISGWVRGVFTGYIPTKRLESLLGRAQWATRPLGGAGPFLAGAYRALYAAKGARPFVHFSSRLACGLASTILLSCLGHSFKRPKKGGGITLFC